MQNLSGCKSSSTSLIRHCAELLLGGRGRISPLGPTLSEKDNIQHRHSSHYEHIVETYQVLPSLTFKNGQSEFVALNTSQVQPDLHEGGIMHFLPSCNNQVISYAVQVRVSDRYTGVQIKALACRHIQNTHLQASMAAYKQPGNEIVLLKYLYSESKAGGISPKGEFCLLVSYTTSWSATAT